MLLIFFFFFCFLPPVSGGAAGSSLECSWDCYPFEDLLEVSVSPGKQGKCHRLKNVFIFVYLPDDVHGTSQCVK